MSDLGPPDLLLLSEENNDTASLESSNASSTLPLLPSLDSAPTGTSSAPSDSQNVHLGVQGANLLTDKEATGTEGVSTDYQPTGSGEPPSSLQTEVSQNGASSSVMMSAASKGDGSAAQGAGDPPHTGDTTPRPSSNLSAAGSISEQSACLNPQQVCINECM